MAIKIKGSIIVDDSRNIVNAGITTANTFVGQINSGVGTITTLNSATQNTTTLNANTANVVSGIVTTLTGTNISYSGIGTVGSLSIDSTQVISSQRQLQNIDSLDTTTKATIESAISVVPNLDVTGITTLGVTSTTNLTSQTLNVSGLSTFSGITTHTNSLFGTQASFVGVVTAASFNGNASSATYASIAGVATALQNARTISLTGDVVGSVSFDGTSNVSIASTIQPNSVALGDDTTGNYVATIADAGSSDVVVNNSGTETAAVTLGLTTTGVSSGSYGSSSAIPTFTVDSRGRLTAAGSVNVSTGITVAGDSGTETINLLNETLTIAGGTNLTSSAASNTVTINLDPNISLTSVNASSVIVTGVTTSTGGFDGNLTGDVTGNADTATKLQTARTIALSGDVVGEVSFDGSANVSIAATIQPNSVTLGGDTTGDYVQSITGTANQITVTGGTGEGSTPTLSVPNQFTAPQDVTVTRDLQVNRNLNVNGNITIGGTSATIFSQTLSIYDPDIVLGYRTDGSGNDVSNDNTANHGGIAVASTEGSPLVQLFIAGIETTPTTYKKIMWFKAGEFAGLGTDAWLANYAVGIGSTQVPNGVRLAAGAVQFTERDLISVRNINASGIITATTFSGNLALSNVTGLGANVATFLATPSSSNLASAVTDETGSGALVFATSPTLVSPTLGNASATTLNVTGVSTFAGLIDSNGGLDVTGQTTLNNNLEVTGVSTFTALVDANGGATIDNVRIGVADDNTIDTSTGNLTLDSNAGTVTINDQLSVSGVATFQSNVNLGDNDRLRFGDGNDLQIYHDGFGSFINESGVGRLRIGGGSEITIENASFNEYKARFLTDGAVELYYDNSKKFETTSAGVTVTGIATAATFYAEGGTYVAAIDSVANAAIVLNKDNANIYTLDGNAQYLRNLISKNSNNIIIGQQGTSYVNDINLKPGASGAKVKLHAGGTTDNVKLETAGYGATVFGTLESQQLNVTGVSTLAANGGITTTGGDLYVGGDLYIKDDLVLDEAIVRNINVTGLSTLGIATATTLSVAGVTTTGSLTVNGTSLFTGGIQANSLIVANGGVQGDLTGTATSTTNIPNLSGNVSSNNTVTTLATVNSNVGTYGDAGAIPSITVNAKGLVTGVTTVAPNNGQLSLAVSGTGLSGSATFTANQSGSSTFTVTSNATDANTPSTIVARDVSGNFSAGTIFANQLSVSGVTTSVGGFVGNLTGTASTATAAATAYGLSGTPNVTVGAVNASGIITASQFVTGPSGSAIGINTNTISGPTTITIDPAGVGDNTGLVVIKGDLQIDGTTTTVNSTTVTVDDKNILLASGAANDAAADGGGITVESGDGNKTWNWVDSTDSWTSSEHIDVASGKVYKVNGTEVLSSNTLGSAVVNSSLTSVGTLTQLNVSGVTTSAGGFVGNLTGRATYATTAGIATYATTAGIATYATTAGIATYATTAGIATYATTAGIATYATTAGIATYATTAGVSTSVVGGHAELTNLIISGVSTLGFFSNNQVVSQSATLGENTTFYSVHKNITVEDGSTLTVGTGSTILLDRFNNLDDVKVDSLVSSGIVTAPAFKGTLKGDIVGITTLGFFGDDQILHESVELGNNTRYYSVHKNITVEDGSTLTVGTGSTILLDRFNNLDDATANSMTSPFIMSQNTIASNFTVPVNYNAMTVGPTVTIASEIIVTISTNGSWSLVP